MDAGFTPSRRALLQGVCAVAMVAACTTMPDVKAPADPFIEDLIGRMSLEEKAGQLSIFTDVARLGAFGVNPEMAKASLAEFKTRIARGEMVGTFNGLGATLAREMQQVAVESSPNKIPLIFAADVIHGLRTIFPIGLAEAASFDVDLAERTARAAAIEMTALGVQWTFAPVVDVARDQRWGRTAEGTGEDPFLGAIMARARVRGFQGDDLKAEDSVLACPKHFAAYGAVEGGMEYSQSDISDTTLRDVHLPPFKAAFDAGALTTMSSFNDVAGVPATGNHYLLTEILRGEWGFKGLVVSDYTSEEELIAHGYAEDGADATVKAVTAGCDISMQSGLYVKHLPELVRSGRVPLAVVDEAVRRVLRVKKAIGLFENPYKSLDPAREKADIRRPEFVTLAREAARKSLVLLKNDNDLLPLAKTQSIALIGPAVSNRADLPGPWGIFGDVQTHVTIEEGFRQALGAGGRLSVVQGSQFDTPIAGGIEAAVAAASAADVAVLVLGESQRMSGEAQSRVEITIPPAQMAVAEAVAATGKPIVVLLRSGRALALSGAVKSARAIMATWFLGSETGSALADVVFGDFAPQGRLPVSFPQSSGQQPFYYNRRNTGRPQLTADANFKARYREVTNEALYPFGHGLTYSAISYGATSVTGLATTESGSVGVRATVTNTGRRPAHEVVQLYIRDKAASITQPIRVLKAFKHIDLEPGQSVTVQFTLTGADLGFAHQDKRTFAEPGAFDVWVAPSATGGEAATFALG